MNQSLKIPGYASFGEVSRMTGLNTTKISNLVKARILETDNFYTLKLIKLESVPHDLSKNTYDRYMSANKKGL